MEIRRFGDAGSFVLHFGYPFQDGWDLCEGFTVEFITLEGRLSMKSAGSVQEN